MSMTVNGRTLTTEDVLREVQRYLGCEGDREGDITHVIRTAYRWQQSEKGIDFHWKRIDGAYNDYRYRTGELPDCVYNYFAEVVDRQSRPQKAGEPS